MYAFCRTLSKCVRAYPGHGYTVVSDSPYEGSASIGVSNIKFSPFINQHFHYRLVPCISSIDI